MQQKKYFTPVIFILLSASTIFSACQDDYNEITNESAGYFGVRSGVAVRAIALADFPATDSNGNAWDSIVGLDTLGSPDIYFRLTDEPDTNNYPGFAQPFQFENVDRDSVLVSPLVYYLTVPYDLKSFGSNVRFDIYDLEKDPASSTLDSTLMKSFIFSISPGDTLTNSNPYPDSLVLDQDGYRALIFLNWKQPK